MNNLISTGKTYTSFEEFIKDTHPPKEAEVFLEELNEEMGKTKLIFQLTVLRLKNGLSIKKMAKLIGKSAKWVDKIENSKDKHLTLGQLKTYLSAFDLDISFIVKGDEYAIN